MMPNHITNIVAVSGDERRIQAMLKEIQTDEYGLGSVDFNKIIPMPDDVDSHNWSIANWGTKWNSYGYTSDTRFKDGKLTFLTAWSAPHPILEKLSEIYPDIKFEHEWADEDIGMNCGRYVYYDGERTEEYYPESSRERIEFAARVMDSEPVDWGLFLNSSETDYVNFSDEEFEVIEIEGQTAMFTNSRMTDADIPKGLHCYHVSFYVKEGAGSSSQYINLYPLTNTTWTETTVTWNNIGNYNTSNNYGNNLTNNQWTAFDITNLVKGWKNGTYSADAGFILTNSNEKSDECFCSSEHATSSYRPYVVVTYNSSGSGGGNSFNNATNLSLNTSASVNVAYADEKRYFKFTPSTTGFYTFESSAISSGDPKAWLYNSSKIELLNNDDGGTGNNFRLTYHLIMGQNYYFVAGCYNTGVGSYNVTISKTTIPSYVAAATINQRNVYTISTNAANKATFYKFTPTQTGEYLFYSSERTGDPKIWLYNSSLSMVGSNDDGAGNLNFRLNVTLTAGQSYYIVAAHLGANTGTYKLNSLFDANIPNSIFYLKNIENSLYIDIDGPGAQEWVHQWSLHTDPQEKWRIKKQDDGYYTIQSEYSLKKYIGISNTNIETNNIKLYSSVSDAARWKIFSTYDGKLIIEPKTAPGKIMCSPNSTAGQELQLSYLYTNDTSHMNKWQLKTATLTINPYYDNAFNVRYTNAANLVESFSPEISRIMWDALGVRVTYNSPKMILSTPDRCKLERGLSINSTNIDVNSDARCPANPSYSNPNCPYYDINKVGHYGWENCTSWYQSYRDFINQYPGNSTTVSVLFNGSRLYDDSGLQCNRSFHWYSNGIILQEIRSSSSSYSSDILPCFLHELSHDLDAPDHYHEMLKDDAGTYYCRGGDMCITCHPETGRAGWCIMRSGWRSDLLTCEPDEIYCEECKNDILEHLGKHHFE